MVKVESLELPGLPNAILHLGSFGDLLGQFFLLFFSHFFAVIDFHWYISNNKEYASFVLGGMHRDSQESQGPQEQQPLPSRQAGRQAGRQQPP